MNTWTYSHRTSGSTTQRLGLLRFDFVSILAESGVVFMTNGLQPLVVKEDNKRNDTTAQHHMLFIIIRRFMLPILSKDQTVSRLGHSELLVVMSKFDLDVNLQASDPRGKFFMESCVCGPRTLHPHMAFG